MGIFEFHDHPDILIRFHQKLKTTAAGTGIFRFYLKTQPRNISRKQAAVKRLLFRVQAGWDLGINRTDNTGQFL
jgi:hypothetical protein